MLQRGDSVPAFQVTTAAGEAFRYETIWQRRNLVLVVAGDVGSASALPVLDHASEFAALEAECVVTADRVAGVPSPGALVADRWGEVVHVQAGLPSTDDLLEWASYTRQRCPECEGETR